MQTGFLECMAYIFKKRYKRELTKEMSFKLQQDLDMLCVFNSDGSYKYPLDVFRFLSIPATLKASENDPDSSTLLCKEDEIELLYFTLKDGNSVCTVGDGSGEIVFNPYPVEKTTLMSITDWTRREVYRLL